MQQKRRILLSYCNLPINVLVMFFGKHEEKVNVVAGPKGNYGTPV